MRPSLRNFAAVALMLLVCPGCELEDADGDGAISVDELVASLQNWVCGDETSDPVDDETETPLPEEETTDPATDPTSSAIPSLDEMT
jgi:hypothetical protein